MIEGKAVEMSPGLLELAPKIRTQLSHSFSLKGLFPGARLGFDGGAGAEIRAERRRGGEHWRGAHSAGGWRRHDAQG